MQVRVIGFMSSEDYDRINAEQYDDSYDEQYIVDNDSIAGLWNAFNHYLSTLHNYTKIISIVPVYSMGDYVLTVTLITKD